MGSFLSKSNVTQDLASFASQTNSENPSDWKTYDYVVVGGGAAGCVLASRLSEDPTKTVLLIEGGGDNENVLFSRIPVGFTKLFKTSYDWFNQTNEEPAASGRRLFWPSGKLLGGSTSLNALIFQHCSPSDMDQWVSDHGAQGWSYNDLLPYFRKCEAYGGDTPDKTGVHGRDGPLHTTNTKQGPLSKAFTKACGTLGIPFKADLCDRTIPLGVGPALLIIGSEGERCSTAVGYLTPSVRQRSNLTIAVNTLVTRVLFSQPIDPSGKPQAIGVEVIQTKGSGSRWRVAASKEVILSSGAVATPQLLMLSGIGPGVELRKNGIPIVKELNGVGRNLKDHCLSMIRFQAKKSSDTFDYLTNTLYSLPALLQWFLIGSGPMTSNAIDTLAFIRSTDESLPFGGKLSKVSTPRDLTSGVTAPDVEIIFAPMMLINHAMDPTPAPGVTLAAGIMRPESVGQITLRSNDIWDRPSIDANYLSSRNDMNIMIRAVRLCMRIGRSEPLCSYLKIDGRLGAAEKAGPELEAQVIDRGHVPDIVPEQGLFWSGNVDPDQVTDEEIERHIGGTLQTIYHPIGTAKIGPLERDGVVDHNLMVHGVDCLRIVDASVLPTLPSGHPMAVIVAVAERASDLIHGKI